MARVLEHRATLAKVSRPRLRGVVARDRLFAALDAALDTPLCWVCGPPGAGKTVLVSSYLDARSRAALWFQLDAGDADPATFFYYLGVAAGALAPSKKRRLPLLTSEYLADVPGFTRRFFRTLFALLPADGVLVLDNFQDAASQPLFLDLIRVAVAEVPHHARLMIICREQPGEAFARAQADRRLSLFDWQELRLDANEALLIAGADCPLEQPVLLRLHAMADGWAAGFVLLVEHAKRAGAHAARTALGEATQAVFDYFASEVFDTLPEPVRAMLLHAAFLPRFSAEAVAALSGDVGAPRLLDALHQRRLFVDKRNGTPPVYQFHPLLRAFLLARARQSLSASQCSEIAGRAADLAERHGEFEAAAALCAEAAQWPRLVRLVGKHAAELLAQGRNQTLATFIDSIPGEITDREPWLLYWRALARLPFTPIESRMLLEQAHALFKDRADASGSLLSCSAIVTSYFYEYSNFSGEDPWIAEMDRLIRADPACLTAEIEAEVVASGVAIMFRAPAHPMLDDWAERGLHIIRTRKVSGLESPLIHFLLQRAIWRGDFALGQRVVADIRASLDLHQAPPLAAIGLELWSGALAVLLDEHAQGQQHFDVALEIGRHNGIAMLNGLILGSAVYGALSVGDLDQASQLLERMQASVLPGRHADQRFVHHLRSGLALLRGDLQTARSVLEGTTLEPGPPFICALNWIVLSMVLVEQRDWMGAQAWLQRSLQMSEAIHADQLRFTALLVMADLHLRTGDEPQALESLASALALGRIRAYFTIAPTFWQPQVMSRLCAHALAHDIESDYVTLLIRKRGIPSPPSWPDNWPWPVKVFTLGRFSLLVNDMPLHSQGKVQRKTLELLQALIALGGRDLDATTLTQALWPDAEGDAAHHALESCVHRLRKLIGREAVAMHGGRIGLDPQRCWVDAWALERSLANLREALSVGTHADRIPTQLARMQALYRGPFLSQCSQPWLLATRERLRGRYLRSLDAAARYFEAAGQMLLALEPLHQGIDLDPFSEDFYRRLMVLYQRLGRPADALAIWHRCQRTLGAGLGISPSAQTEDLAHELQR